MLHFGSHAVLLMVKKTAAHWVLLYSNTLILLEICPVAEHTHAHYLLCEIAEHTLFVLLLTQCDTHYDMIEHVHSGGACYYDGVLHELMHVLLETRCPVAQTP